MLKDASKVDEFYKDISQEMEKTFSGIVDIVKKFNPLELIEYLSIIFYFCNSIGINEFFTLAEMDFICGLILSIQCEGENHYEEISPQVIQNLLDNVKKYFIGFNLLTYHGKLLNVNDDIEKEKQFLSAFLALEYGIVRGDAYVIQLKEQVQSLFKDFDEWMMKYEGFTINDAIKFIDLLFNRYSKILYSYGSLLY